MRNDRHAAATVSDRRSRPVRVAPAARGATARAFEALPSCALAPTLETAARFLHEHGLQVHEVVIVRATDRDQLRTQLTGAKMVRTAAYPSRKTRRARFMEAAAEIVRVPQEEVEVDKVDAIAQPVRGEVLLDDGWHIVIPDFANLLADGRRVIVEAKRHWSDFTSQRGRFQEFLARTVADAMGYGYERFALANGGSARRRENIDEIQAARFVHVPDHLVALASRTLAAGPISRGNLAQILHPVNGRSMVHALMVRRIVEIDLEAKLDDRSECRAVPPLPHGMPSIRH